MVTNQGKTITHSLSMVDLRLLGSTSRDRFPATLLASTADIRDTTRARLDLGVPRLTLTKVLGQVCLGCLQRSDFVEAGHHHCRRCSRQQLSI